MFVTVSMLSTFSQKKNKKLKKNHVFCVVRLFLALGEKVTAGNPTMEKELVAKARWALDWVSTSPNDSKIRQWHDVKTYSLYPISNCTNDMDYHNSNPTKAAANGNVMIRGCPQKLTRN